MSRRTCAPAQCHSLDDHLASNLRPCPHPSTHRPALQPPPRASWRLVARRWRLASLYAAAARRRRQTRKARHASRSPLSVTADMLGRLRRHRASPSPSRHRVKPLRAARAAGPADDWRAAGPAAEARSPLRLAAYAHPLAARCPRPSPAPGPRPSPARAPRPRLRSPWTAPETCPPPVKPQAPACLSLAPHPPPPILVLRNDDHPPRPPASSVLATIVVLTNPTSHTEPSRDTSPPPARHRSSAPPRARRNPSTRRKGAALACAPRLCSPPRPAAGLPSPSRGKAHSASELRAGSGRQRIG